MDKTQLIDRAYMVRLFTTMGKPYCLTYQPRSRKSLLPLHLPVLTEMMRAGEVEVLKHTGTEKVYHYWGEPSTGMDFIVQVYRNMGRDYDRNFVDRAAAIAFADRQWVSGAGVYKVEVFEGRVDPPNLVDKPHRVYLLK